MPVERIHVVPGPEFRRVVAALDVVEKTTNKKLQKAAEDGLAPHIRAARDDVSADELPGGQVGRRGLQRRVARGVQMLSQSGPTINRIRVITSMPERDESIIPRGMDRPRGWVHPVFGNRANQVRQLGGSWFMPHMQNSRGDIEENMTDVLEEAADFVGRAGGAV